MKKYYNIHDIVKFKVVADVRLFDRFFSNIEIEYKNFEVDKADDLDFSVYVGRFKPQKDNCYILDNKYYVKENYFYGVDSYKLARWAFELQGFETGHINLRISTNPLGLMFISAFLIDFLIHYKMNKKSYPLVHGACVSKDNQAYIFSSQGGGGKTTTALYFVEDGFDFLGDNFTIVHDGMAFAFHSPLNLFTFNFHPFVKRRISLEDKISLYLKHAIYLLTMGYARLVTKLNPKDVFEKSVVDSSKLNSVFILVPKNESKIEQLEKEELVGHLVMNQKMDTFPFIKYLVEYAYMFPKSKIAAHWIRYEKNLRKSLKNIPAYRIEVPRKYDKETFENISRMINR